MAIPFISTNVVDAVKVLQQDLAYFFPELTHFYGYASGPDHNTRRCLDAMVYDSSNDYVEQQNRRNLPYDDRIELGNRVDAFLRKNAAHYGLNGVIWNRKVRGYPHVGGQRSYRGPYGTARPYSISAHDDHLHIEVDGSPVRPLRPFKNFVWDGKSFPGNDKFFIGARAKWITFLGQRLVIHGWTGYEDGPGPEFTETDRKAVEWFQKKQGWTGSDADGYPGSQTWSLLTKNPEPISKPVVTPVQNEGKDETVFEKIAFVNPTGEGNWQGTSLAGGYWYVVQAWKRSDGSEDCRVYRIKDNPKDRSNLKSTEAPMLIDAEVGFKIHPTGWGVSDDGCLWLTANDSAEGNDIVTVYYKSGATVKKRDCQEMNVFSGKNNQIAFDTGNKVAAIRTVTTKNDTFVLRNKEDILDGKNEVLGKVVTIRRKNRVVQGFTVVKNAGDNWELLVLLGLDSADSPFEIERWSFVTNSTKPIDVISIPRTLGREPEGIDGYLFAMKTKDRSGLDVYKVKIKE